MEKKVKLKLYGPLREKAGDFIWVTVEGKITHNEIIKKLAEILKLNEEQKNSIRIAGNSGFLKNGEEIKDSELHIIPPVGGG